MSKFLIVEDHPVFAEGLQLTIRQGLPEACTVHAGSLALARDALSRDQDFALVLLDLWLPDTHGFEGLIALRREFPKLPIVIVSGFADQGVVHKAMTCGAAGFIPKSATRDDIVQGLRTVLAGDVTLPIDYLPAHMVANEDLAALTGRLSSLIRQQLRVLQMLCQGLLNKQIAYYLDVCETTVKAHVGEILRKLSVALAHASRSRDVPAGFRRRARPLRGRRHQRLNTRHEAQERSPCSVRMAMSLPPRRTGWICPVAAPDTRDLGRYRVIGARHLLELVARLGLTRFAAPMSLNFRACALGRLRTRNAAATTLLRRMRGGASPRRAPRTGFRRDRAGR